MRPSVVVGIDGLSVRGRFGVTEEERAVEQDVIVDVSIRLRSCEATRSDEVADTADYGAACKLVAAVARRSPYRTLERFCDAIAGELSGAYERQALQVAKITVRATKPAPPIDGKLERAYVELERGREKIDGGASGAAPGGERS